jgi:WD40 repeat protein/tRNA A-37 threonylcarbamoyl transferase component Bud32
MASNDADANLLFGVLALQMDFIAREQLIAAVAAWALDKSRPLADVLVAQGALSGSRRAILDPLVHEHLRAHGDDPQCSLAAIGSASSVRRDLARVGDADVLASLAAVDGARQAVDRYATTPPLADEPNHLRSRFRILRPHARGGLGEVYVARDEELHREVALKQIQHQHADDPASRTRFVREAEVTGGLEHPGIVPVYGLGHYPDGRPYYAMRFIRGDSLKEAIARFHAAEAPGRDPSERALELRKLLGRFVDVCDAIAYAHSRGVLHRDLKPANVMLGKYGETLVVDWGLAKATESGPGDLHPEEPPLAPSPAGETAETRLGETIGTPAYMSPEQAAGRLDRLGPASDVYSLGATLYHLLTGKPPFAGQDNGAVLRRVRSGEFPRPQAASRAVPAALEAVCLKAMALRPEDRYPTPRALADDIEHWLADERVSAHAEGLGQRLGRAARRHRAWVQVGAAALVLVSVISLVAWARVEAARRRANRSAHNEAIAAAQAKEQAAEAKKQLRETRIVSALALLDRGVSFCEQGRLPQGVRWLARALQVAPEDADEIQHAIRINLSDWSQAVHPVRGRFEGPGMGSAVAFRPDGRVLAMGGSDKTARLWDVATGRPIGEPLRHEGRVLALAYSPDGRALATVDEGDQPMGFATPARLVYVRLWDVATGRPIGEPMFHGNSIPDLAFRPDGKALATEVKGVSGHTTVRLWDVATGRPIGEPLRHEGSISSVAFSADGRTMATVGQDGNDGVAVRLWDAATGRPISSPVGLEDKIYSVVFSPDCRTLATTGDVEGKVRLWDAAAGLPIGEPLHHEGFITGMAFRPDGKALATASFDKTVQLWDAADGRPIGPPLRHRAPVGAVAFSPDGRLLATTTWDDKAWLWDMATSRPIGEMMDHGGGVTALAYSPDGRVLATGGDDKVVRLWDAATGRPIGPPMRHEGRVLALAYGPDGRTMATVDGTYLAHLWDVATGRLIGEPLRHEGWISGVAFRPDGKALATASFDKTAQLWDAATGRPIGQPMRHEGRAAAVAFRPDGKALATASFDKTARLWDAATGRPIGTPMRHAGPVTALAFSADGRALATGSEDLTARLWDAATGRPIGTPMDHGHQVRAVAISPDGRLLATARGVNPERSWDFPDRDDSARLWDTATSRPIGEPLRHWGTACAIAFRPDGKALATGSNDRSVRIWKVPTIVPGSPERLTLWTEVLTGLEIDSAGVIRELDAQEWYRRRDELERLGGPPAR